MKIRMQCTVALLAILGGAGFCNYAQAQNTTLYLAHAAPGRLISATANPELPWDFSINGICITKGISFGEIRGPFTGPAGTYTLRLEVANSAFPCTGNTVFSASVTLSAGVTNFEVATLDATNHVTGQIFSADLTPVTAGFTRLEIVNATLSPVSAQLFNTGGFVGALTVPAATIVDSFAAPGLYTATLNDVNTNKLLFGPVNAALGPRDLYLYVVAGSATNQSVQLIGPKAILGVF